MHKGENMDKIFLEFPLCSLIQVGNNYQEVETLISYNIVAHSNKLEFGTEKERIEQSAEHLGIIAGSIQNTKMNYERLNKFTQNFMLENGKDSYCRIGKKLMFEVLDGRFDFKQFLVLCAFSSILGKKKKFVRITYDRIRYAMYGYKSKKIFEKTGTKIELLTDKQLKRIIDILHSKKFFSKFTYRNRQIYYSTKLEDEELREAVKNSKIYWKKKQLQIVDKIFSNEIKSELDKLNLEIVTKREQRRLEHGRLRLIKVRSAEGL
jgi:hypothetical protein